MTYPIPNFDFTVKPNTSYSEFSKCPEKYYQEPFKIMGRLYYIGSKINGGFLIDSGDGLIVVDTGYQVAAPMLVDSIWRLGFDPKNIKMIFHTHKHSDHCGTTKFLKQLSGATTYMGEKDAQASITRIEKEGQSISRFIPDVFLKDGDEFTLGEVTIRCYETPGHSAGCMTFFFDLYDEEGNKYVTALPGDVALNTLHKNYITQWDPYPTAQEDFFAWTERMMDWRVDIMLSPHTRTNHMLEKYEDMKKDPDHNPFVDPNEWKETLTAVREQLKKNIRLEEEGKMWLDCSGPNQKLMISDDVTDVE